MSEQVEAARLRAEEAEREYQQLKRKLDEQEPATVAKRVRLEEFPNEIYEHVPASKRDPVSELDPPPAHVIEPVPPPKPKLTAARVLAEIYTPVGEWEVDSANSRSSCRVGVEKHSEVVELLEKVATELKFRLTFSIRRLSSPFGPVKMDIVLTTPDRRLGVHLTHVNSSDRYPHIKTDSTVEVFMDKLKVAWYCLRPDNWIFQAYMRGDPNPVPAGHPYASFAPEQIGDDHPHATFLRYLVCTFDMKALISGPPEGLQPRLRRPEFATFGRVYNR